MKRIFQFLSAAALLSVAVSSCWKIDEGDTVDLAPIEFKVASDTINADLGVELKYEGLTVKSDREVSYEWSYGQPADGKTVADHIFKTGTIENVSTSPTIDYTFTKLGTFILRLRADNGESIQYKYFTLNVNSGYDEGVTILSNGESGDGHLTFIKTLTSEEATAGKQEVFPDVFSSINPGQTLRNGKELFMSNATVKKVDYSGLLIATDDENGTMWHMEAKTFQLFKKSSMLSAGSRFKAFGGELASTSGFAAFILGENSHIYRYDMMMGDYTDMIDIKQMTGIFGGVSRKTAKDATIRSPYFRNSDSLAVRRTASAGTVYYTLSGYEVVNMATLRTAKTNSLYVLFRSKTNPDEYVIKNTDGIGGSGALKTWGSTVTFTTGDLKMDSDCKFVGTKNSADVYYVYDNAVYRWSLISAPATKPTITLPAGEQIRDIATNFLGKDKGDNGEDLLYIATYNPSRSGEKKGSLYVYRFSDDTLVKSYEGIFWDPASVMYKYRVN